MDVVTTQTALPVCAFLTLVARIRLIGRTTSAVTTLIAAQPTANRLAPRQPWLVLRRHSMERAATTATVHLDSVTWRPTVALHTRLATRRTFVVPMLIVFLHHVT